jgi:FkbM family methyltransferase
MMSLLAKARCAARQVLARRLHIPEIPIALRRLRKNGFIPTVVADVGAYRGEFARECLSLWPGCRVFCFEAQSSALPHLREMAAADSRVRVIEALVGAKDAPSVSLNIADTASSILSECSKGAAFVEDHRMVALENVEEFQSSRSLDLLKIDVQGYELEVLRGAESLLPRTRMILVELNLIDIYRDVPLMPEVISWLHSREFVPFDVCGLTRRPLDDALWQADLIFVPVSSPLRSDKSWSAA